MELELLLEPDGRYSPHWFVICADAVVADTRLPCDPNCQPGKANDDA